MIISYLNNEKLLITWQAMFKYSMKSSRKSAGNVEFHNLLSLCILHWWNIILCMQKFANEIRCSSFEASFANYDVGSSTAVSIYGE